MSEPTESRAVAQVGLAMIEGAILHLLAENPQGLRNADIAARLGLHSDFNGRQKDYLTYSVLGGLLRQNRITRDIQTKRFVNTYLPPTAVCGGRG